MTKRFGIGFFKICLVMLLMNSCQTGYDENNSNKCEKTNQWDVREFAIIEKKCPDMVLSHYIIYEVYKNNKKLEGVAYKMSDCGFQTVLENRDTLILNFCTNSIDTLKRVF